jgi:hypothetical protein
MTEQKIKHWDVYEVQLPGKTERTQHIVGRAGWKQDFVVTDALVGINDETRIASTVVGARYELGEYVQGGVEVDTYWAWWRDKQSAADVVRVTANVKASLLSSREHNTGFEPLTPAKHSVIGKAEPVQHGAVLASVLSSTAEQTVGELMVELSEFMKPYKTCVFEHYLESDNVTVHIADFCKQYNNPQKRKK